MLRVSRRIRIRPVAVPVSEPAVPALDHNITMVFLCHRNRLPDRLTLRRRSRQRFWISSLLHNELPRNGLALHDEHIRAPLGLAHGTDLRGADRRARYGGFRLRSAGDQIGLHNRTNTKAGRWNQDQFQVITKQILTISSCTLSPPTSPLGAPPSPVGRHGDGAKEGAPNQSMQLLRASFALAAAALHVALRGRAAAAALGPRSCCAIR